MFNEKKILIIISIMRTIKFIKRLHLLHQHMVFHPLYVLNRKNCNHPNGSEIAPIHRYLSKAHQTALKRWSKNNTAYLKTHKAQNQHFPNTVCIYQIWHVNLEILLRAGYTKNYHTQRFRFRDSLLFVVSFYPCTVGLYQCQPDTLEPEPEMKEKYFNRIIQK